MTTKSLREPAGGDALDVGSHLLRCEMRMIDRYAEAIRMAPQDDMAESMLKVQRSHEWAAALLRTDLLETGALVSDHGGDWETLSAECKATEDADDEGGVPGPFNLAALQRGEERCFERYTQILEREDVPQGCKDLIRTELLPLPARNIEILRSIVAMRHVRFSRSPFGQSRW